MAGNFQFEKKRVERLRDNMSEKGVDLVVIPPGPNFFYFSGLETETMERLALLLVSSEEATVISPKMLEEQLEQDSWITDVHSWTDNDNPYRIAQEIMDSLKPSSIAVDDALPYFQYYPLFQKQEARTKPAGELISPLRMIKDSEELDRISTAISRSEKSLKQTLDEITEGITEKDVAAMLENNFMKSGLDRIAFSSIVAAGENSSVPHHSPSDRKIRKNEPIVIDFGGSYRGYSSDTTRTVFLGSAPPEIEKIYEINREAQETSISELSSSHTYADADRIARDIIEKGGYGERFIHRLGHGLGISVHEDPYLVPTNTELMIEKSVFTIEPGIYLPGKGGVRIEDTTAFTNGKCRPFNKFTKELTVL